MPVVGVASKLRQPAVGSKPIHTALPIPNPGRSSMAHGLAPRSSELRVTESSMLSCQLSFKTEIHDRRSTLVPAPSATLARSSRQAEESKICKIYTDWANHYLAKSGCPRLIKDLTQDIPDGVLLAEIIQIIANEKVDDINSCPKSHSQMIENVEACLNFLGARGVSVQGLSAEEVCNGNLKSILGLFFILSRYKQQQQHQQQYLQSLVELQQHVTHQTTGAAPASQHKTQDMQSSLTARYTSPPGHSGIAAPQKKNTRLPGPSRVPAAGSGSSSSKAHGSSNLNRRSQSFNSIDKSKPLQYASGNDRESVKGIPLPGSMNGSGSVPSSTSGQQLASAIPSPTAGKSWRSKSMNIKHSATSSMLATKPPSPTASPTPPLSSDRLRPPITDASKSAPGNQRSMLEKFRLINPRSASRTSPSVAEMALQEEDDLSEFGDEGTCSPTPPCGISKQQGKTSTSSFAPPNKTNNCKNQNNKSLPQSKDKEDKNKTKSKASTPPKEEPVIVEPSKKGSKIASLIPKGSKTSTASVKKESAIPASSGIPKPGLKAPTATAKPAATQPSVPAPSVPATSGEKTKLSKGSQSIYMQRSLGGLENRKTSMVSSTSTSALSGSATSGLGGGAALGGNGAVQLPQQQQHNHPNTATVAPFMYRTYSENDCTTVVPPEPCLSPTKDLVYSKTAKQCLEEISGEDPETRRMRTVKNIADLRQNLEETMSSLRGTQISHSTLETTFDTTVTTEVNGRGLPALSSRSSPMSWRLGQGSTPRLQAGDAPSYAPPRSSAGTTGRYGDPSRLLYTAPLRRAAASGVRGSEPGEKGGVSEAGPEVDVTGYGSDGDILAKNVHADDISGYHTDGGLYSRNVDLYSRNVGRPPEMMPTREVVQKGVKEMQGEDSWDDSSSVSSGLSDTLDNIGTDDLNPPTYSGISSRKSKAAQSNKDTNRHTEQDGSSWAGAEDLKKVDEEMEPGMDPSCKWKTSSPSSSCQGEDVGQKTGLPMSQTGSWRRGMSAQVGITPPRTKGSSTSLKTPGKTDDAKASEKGKAPSKSPSIQRSPSDAGKSSGDEGKKPPSGIGRPPTTSSFGFKKIPGPAGALITASGATLTSGSATLGKVPKSAGIGKGAGIGNERKTSLDGAQHQDDAVLLGCGGSKVPLQYRSLPRPAKSSSGGSSVVGRSGHRSSSSSIDSNVSGKSAGGSGGVVGTPTSTKRRDPGKVGSGRSSPITINQTDKEKVAGSDQEGTGLSTSPKSSPTSTQSGLRQPGSKYPDIASPTFRRLFGSKTSSKPSSPGTPDSGKCPSALGSPHGTLARQASLDSPSSGTGSLGSMGGQSGGSSPLYGKTPDLGTDSPASSPASGLSLPSNARPWPPNLSSSSAGSKDTLSCHSMTSLHTSSESIDLPLPHHHGPKVTRTGSVKSTLSEGMPLDRNTLPKKGLRYPPSSRQTSHEEGKEWLRSHSTGGLQDTGSPLSPPGTTSTGAGKYHYSNLLSPTSMSQFNLPSTSMSRSNSIPAQDSFELYGEGHTLGGSATSLEERPRGMSRSGSFRDSTDEVHGSSLSLVSSTSSLYSAVLAFLDKTEEKAHSEGQTVQNTTQIRKLRRELDASQEKVATLTSQLAANAHLVAAFEKSLANMTCRLQSLTMTAEQKESELAELRETIEALKAQNTDAQTAIQVALNGPDHVHKADLRIRRQHSSESMSSINSAASHSSMGSAKDAEDKKKKKKSWLRSSFKQAFSKKKTNKPQSPHDEIEEMTDSSLPSSPKLQHADRQTSTTQPLRSSPSTTEKCFCDSKSSPIWMPKKKSNGHVVYKHRSRLCECTEAEAEIILQLKNELREKELKLTDIRLEALSSAHHLDQIREAMNRMQNEIELLKAENDRLKSSGNTTPAATPAKTARPPSETSSTSSSSSRQSLGLSLNNLNITDTIMSDILLDDGYEGNLRKEGRSVRIVVTINSDSNKTKAMQKKVYLIGSIGVSGKTKWDVLDGVIRRLFKEYVFRVDPLTSLGLNSDSIVCYRMGDVVRSHASEVPELLPCGYLVGDNNVITVSLKGVKEGSIDDLVFDTLIPKPIIQRYLNLLMEHRRIILSGPSGTGKSYLATKLAYYIISKTGREVTDTNLASFNVDQKSSKQDLRQYLSSLAEQCNTEECEIELPTVVILDNLHHIGSLSDIFNGFLNCKYHKCPYVIGTMNQGVSSSPNLELHHNFRWVLCANHTEPVKGFLGRFLRRKLIETEIDKNMRSNDLIKIIDWIPKTWQHLNSFLEAHSSSDVTIGPRLFLSCPMDADGSRVWFTDLWNYSLVPYLLEAVREGLQLYGKRAAWEDPSKWVIDTYPWSSASLQHEGQSLLQLRPEDVGYDGYTSSKDGAASKQVSQSDTEGDPLMNMLMRLQEAANYSSAQSCDSDSASHHDDLLDSSLESAL
ncbi:neuron navigator 3 isoform X12 [Megalobrama amblycephala]|uniref:neuron navigator 3 isoform X12 n=1 Tax=Megalobrama amblycephala TaxID=75352 RepID=UPI002013D8D4|nr:neuron navigator 3 isoform X12 [Megalobrama amblycephala]